MKKINLTHHADLPVQSNRQGFPENFGCDVFSELTMKRTLEPEVFCAWKSCVRDRKTLPLSVAEPIACAMKHWALERGATHYTHWFQPLTGITAEKHESFLHLNSNGHAITSFDGAALIRGESDASSFPSGGLRATFEARGYTAWDPTAFAFVKDGSLYIPTCFFSYNGAALDKKTPLLRSIEEVNREAVRVLRLLGDHETRSVIPSVGIEQEYFLLDKRHYDRRDDLRMTGRTLFGAPTARGQTMDDHYYGAIRPRVLAYMRELDTVLWRLGIPAKTRHNEVAPCQHELAPIHTHVNTACDGNQIIMEVMKKTAEKHGLVCLFHEKPFAGINGSGKHNNWSLTTDTGENLFSPGKTPGHNARFLLFLSAFISGVDRYQDWLRCTAASAGNDLRLGADEAPPAIVSIFLGTELTEIVHAIIQNVQLTDPPCATLRIGIDVLPPIPRDTSDRNRTAPLAFTGNKFEFRMLGANQCVTDTNIALNTIMAEELKDFADHLEKTGNTETSLQQLIHETLSRHQRIISSGNCYDRSWHDEAKCRDLSILPTTATCLSSYLSASTIDLVIRRGIFTAEEFRARYTIHMENYCKVIRIEALTMISMIRQQILPAVSGYTSKVCLSLLRKQSLGLPSPWETSLSARLAQLTGTLSTHCDALESAVQASPPSGVSPADYCRQAIFPAMEAARTAADQLEVLTEKTSWPFPTYSDLLFYA